MSKAEIVELEAAIEKLSLRPGDILLVNADLVEGETIEALSTPTYFVNSESSKKLQSPSIVRSLKKC